MSGKRELVFATAGVLVPGGGVWGWTAWRGGERSTLPKELSVRSLQAKASDPGAVFEEARKAMEAGNLTEQQRHELWSNVHTAIEARMEQRLDEYFAAGDPSARKALLDRHIDRMQSRMKEWEKRRTEREREGGARPDRGGAPGSGDRREGRPEGFGSGSGPGGAPPGGPRGEWRPPGPPSREQRKMRSESRDPDQSARRMACFTALRQRAKERGIELPRMGPPR